jgi:hypothetical protein
MINYKKIKILMLRIVNKIVILLLLSLNLFVCENRKVEYPDRSWSDIIKEVELTLASTEPDSIKSQKLFKIFETHDILLEDYRRFYEALTAEEQMRSISFLKQVERQIAEDMKNYSEAQQKKMQEYKEGLRNEK